MTGSENTPTVSWCFREASTVNPIVADLLCVRAEMNSGALLISSVFYHPGPLNTMAYNASCRFDLPGNKFLSFFRSKYCPSQSAGLWTLCHAPTEITSGVISVLRRRMSGLATLLITARHSSTISFKNYVPRCRSSIGSMILPSQWQRSIRCTATRSVIYTGISSLKSERTWCLQPEELSPRSTYWMDAPIPENHVVIPLETSISASAASSTPIPFKTTPPLSISMPPLPLLWMPPGTQALALFIGA